MTNSLDTETSFHLNHGNSPQRRIETSSSHNSTLGNGQFELSALNISSVEETHHQGNFFGNIFSHFFKGFSRNRNAGKPVERRNPVNPVIQRRTRGSRPRQFIDNLITFDPQVDN